MHKYNRVGTPQFFDSDNRSITTHNYVAGDAFALTAGARVVVPKATLTEAMFSVRHISSSLAAISAEDYIATAQALTIPDNVGNEDAMVYEYSISALFRSNVQADVTAFIADSINVAASDGDTVACNQMNMLDTSIHTYQDATAYVTRANANGQVLYREADQFVGAHPYIGIAIGAWQGWDLTDAVIDISVRRNYGSDYPKIFESGRS